MAAILWSHNGVSKPFWKNRVEKPFCQALEKLDASCHLLSFIRYGADPHKQIHTHT